MKSIDLKSFINDMEIYKSIYKAKWSMLSPKTKRVNERTAIRSAGRNEQFISRRSISASPATVVSPATNAKTTKENKVNILKATVSEQPSVDKFEIQPVATNHTPGIAKVASNRNVGVLSREEEFLHRFVEWRWSKKQQYEMKKHGKAMKKPPFVPVRKDMGSSEGKDSKLHQQTSVTSSFAPKNHRFKPPEGLKDPVSLAAKATPNKAKQRPSIYTLAPTPCKKKPDPVNVVKRCNMPPKALPNDRLMRPGTTAKSVVSKATASTKTQTQKTPLLNEVKTTKAIVQRDNVAKPKSITSQKNPATNAADGATKVTVDKPKAQASIKPPPLEMPPQTLRSVPATVNPKIQSTTRIVKPIRGGGGATDGVKQGGAVGKAKAATTKRTDPISKSKPNLNVCMKAKKVNPMVSTRKATANKVNPAKLKLKKQQLLEVVGQKTAPIAETPLGTISNTTPFGTFITSTQRKAQSGSQSALQLLSLLSSTMFISPVMPVKGTPNRASARQCQPLKTLSNNRTKSPEKVKKRKFNFVLYDDDTPSKLIDDETKTDGKEQTPSKPSKDKSILKESDDQSPLDHPSAHLSVTRGKANSKDRKKKRNTIYLQAETLEALETVRYFRQRLSDEMKRLHDICDKWEAYKSDNLLRLKKTGGDNMISVTIGQTKLLTSKEFMQFTALIDRCEKGVASPHLLTTDGSEDTKSITAVHLKSFWSTIELLIDNVDKCFMNLDRWRENDWLDPDHVQQQQEEQQVAKLRKPKKGDSVQSSIVGKAKPCNDFQELILKTQAGMRKKKSPGTAKRVKLKNVISNKTLSMKKSDQSNWDGKQADITVKEQVVERPDAERKPPNFNNGGDDDDGDKRTYILRTRKVVLRPSSEIEIP